MKGEHAGRPLRSPCVNSSGVQADRRFFVPDYLFYCFVFVYNSGIYRTKLKGSVVPYIRQEDIVAAFVEMFGP